MQLFRPFFILSLLAVINSACNLQEDPGPIQFTEQHYSITDFDRLDIGDAMYITVAQGAIFKIEAQGDRRNLDDLQISKVGNTLVARFNTNRNRRHTTSITITMPELRSANFYGATTAAVTGFESDDFSMNLSGASLAQMDLITTNCNVILSGASNLSLSGTTANIKADISGASLLKAYNMMAEDVTITVSGASHCYVRASATLVADASGASSVLYRGDATVTSKVSGSSSIMKD